MRLALGSHSDMGARILIEFVSNAVANTRRTADAIVKIYDYEYYFKLRVPRMT